MMLGIQKDTNCRAIIMNNKNRQSIEAFTIQSLMKNRKPVSLMRKLNDRLSLKAKAPPPKVNLFSSPNKSFLPHFCFANFLFAHKLFCCLNLFISHFLFHSLRVLNIFHEDFFLLYEK